MVLTTKQRLAAVLVILAVGAQPYEMRGQSLTFTTFAGPEGGSGFDDGMGSAARFDRPEGVATDDAGNVYVVDTDNNTVRKISPAGAVTTLAGLAGSAGSADGIGSAARFGFMRQNELSYLHIGGGVATDGSGNVYVADTGNATIRKIAPSGAVTTLAGLAGSRGSADGTGSEARFGSPLGIATDGSGNVYVTDVKNETIRRITPAGAVTTLAGLPLMAGSVDGSGSAARFSGPRGIATDSGGNIYVADSNNNTIRKIAPTGEVTTVAGLAGATGSTDGKGTAARFDNPEGVATDSSGNVYVADTDSTTIRKITPSGNVTTFAGVASRYGSDDGIGSAARFAFPKGMTTDGAGNVYVADSYNNTIRKITPAGAVTTLAGLSADSGSADGTGSTARFLVPWGMATDSSGNVYVTQFYGTSIRKITPAGEVTTLASGFYFPEGVATDSSGNVYVADTGNHTIRKISGNGVVTTLAGLAGSYGSTDGMGSAARFDRPAGVATDGSGNVYVVDKGNGTIRKITPAGAVTTLAGRAGTSGSIDGTGSEARFYDPAGIATDGSGNVYVADFRNDTIRKITPSGEVTTLAGLAKQFGSVDATGSEARFGAPIGVTVDSSGNVYVAEAYYGTIRKITPAGAVTTVGGLAGAHGTADGTGAAARFSEPAGVAIDGSGNLYVADSINMKIRVGRPALGDIATIGLSTSPGATWQLDTAPATAFAWEWSVIRRPADSVALLSSTSIRNPTFAPDVPGLFTFRLVATGAGASSITTVDFSNVSTGGRRRPVRR